MIYIYNFFFTLYYLRIFKKKTSRPKTRIVCFQSSFCFFLKLKKGWAICAKSMKLRNNNSTEKKDYIIVFFKQKSLFLFFSLKALCYILLIKKNLSKGNISAQNQNEDHAF